jgi:hypothetical protein
MSNPAWQGKTVVIVWEHKHIANTKLERAFPGEQLTLRQLLGLDKLKDVPESWPSGNYDYFWSVDYAEGSTASAGFPMVKQDFAGPMRACHPMIGAPRTGSRRKASAI